MPRGQSDPPQPPSAQPPSAHRRFSFVSVLPFALTVLVSVIITILVQSAFPIHQQDPVPVPSVASPTPTLTHSPTITATATPDSPATPTTRTSRATATPTRTATPVPSLPLDEAAMGQEIFALRAEINHLWSAYYLARAANQLADAEAALRVNDLDEVEQVLVTVGVSLDRAYERSPEQDKGPISEFHMQVSRMLEELHVRPEGMDQKLRRLRQSMLTLVDEDE